MGVHFLTQYRNPLAYPAGVPPGFDLNHPAGKLVAFSSVAQNGSHIELRTGQIAVLTGSPVPKMDAHAGPTLNMNAAAGNYAVFSGQDTRAPVSGTFGMIGMLTSSMGAGYNYIFSVRGSGSSGMYPLIQTDIFKHHNNTGAIISSGITLEIGVAYFLAFSYSPDLSVTDFYIKNLMSGKLVVVQETSGTGVTDTAGTGNIWLGCSERDTYPTNRTSFAATMYSRAYTPPAAMLQWAADPWSFWYPNPGDNWIAAQAAAGGLFKITGNPRSLAGFGGGLAA